MSRLQAGSAPSTASADRSQILIADFESATYSPWAATGTAFGAGPAQGTLPNQQAVDGFTGHGLASSYVDTDGSTGTLTSPTFRIQRNYISFLIGGGNHPGRTCINLRVNGNIVQSATGGDAEHLDPMTWDVKPYQGQAAQLQIVDRETGQWGHISVDQIVQTDHPSVPPDADMPVYHERFRPQFHFTSKTNWINDPNGLVFYRGEYHLFFQHNPQGIEWGNMTWGHAISPDLVHWKQLNDALKPDALGTEFSGSAVIDWKNTSGFGSVAHPPMVAMFTAAGGTSPASQGRRFTQCIAYSNDQGRSWTKYAGNPVIAHVANENRDPHVIWYEPTKRWVAVLYKDVADTFCLFDSADLKHWRFLQDFHLDGCSECPDLFPLPVDGNPSNIKWVVTAADGRYLVGSFDGQSFKPEQERQQVDFGNAYYAVQTFSDVPDGRRIQIAWMRGGRYPRMPFNGQMSFPCELTLHSTPGGPRLFRTPVREIESLQGGAQEWGGRTLKPGENPLASVRGDLFRIKLDIEPEDATEVGLNILGHTIKYSVPDHTLDALGSAPLMLENGHLRLDILVDRTSIETFANNGRVSMTSCFLPAGGDPPLALYSKGGVAKLGSLSVFPLSSAWPAGTGR